MLARQMVVFMRQAPVHASIIERHLKVKGLTFRIKCDSTFSHSNCVLEAK
jgi:hypothetical protein